MQAVPGESSLVAKLREENKALRKENRELRKRIRTVEEQRRINLLVHDKLLLETTYMVGFSQKSANFFEQMADEFTRHQEELDVLKHYYENKCRIAFENVTPNLLMEPVHENLETVVEDDIINKLLEATECKEELEEARLDSEMVHTVGQHEKPEKTSNLKVASPLTFLTRQGCTKPSPKRVQRPRVAPPQKPKKASDRVESGSLKKTVDFGM
ncbi:unnamed protein product [Bursaphelenchus okinawaensis]|uniref:Uncharacterized protein n=1 Tax=Bursaphelenchus okinawaensis TaxID=465554 RepID=A0A811LDF8_9BILA|nr:unnamed protein product [Bursaphelenchus okinawaensis]CAG9120442.1 unnamed protein product [Bursaphelenchus okinawaensis]